MLRHAEEAVGSCDLFMSIGTSSVVYPAAGFAAQVTLDHDMHVHVLQCHCLTLRMQP